MVDLGPWEPLTPEDVRDLFAGAPFPWWLAGGWSLDRLLGHQSRDHADTDVLAVRPDAARVRAHLKAWDVHVADPPGSGTLRPWPAHEDLPAHLHDVWCRPTPADAWRLQVMLDEVEGDDWVYRRDRRVRRPLSSLSGRASTPGLPVLAPEVQLLYKSTYRRQKDETDLERIGPLLTTDETAWLRGALRTAAPGHPWLRWLGGPEEA
jgi:aminoglycoside-2''-adenylyltransferase